MPFETLKSLLRKKQDVHGIWRLIQSDQVTEIIASSGFDFQILDREHGGFTFPQLESAIRTCEAAGSSPLVRVTGLNSTEVQKCLDIGAHGVVFPQLGNAKDFAKAVQCMKFAPNGCRGFNPFTRAGRYASNLGPTEMLTDDFAVCMPILETLSAFRELDQILEIPGIDSIYVGAYDLSVQLGCKGEMTHPTLLKTIDDIIKKCADKKIPSGVMVSSAEQIETYKERGAKVFVHTVDTNIIQKAFFNQTSLFRKTK